MSIHSNPITNVTSKKTIKIKHTTGIVVRARKESIEDTKSFLEMSMYSIKKYFKHGKY